MLDNHACRQSASKDNCPVCFEVSYCMNSFLVDIGEVLSPQYALITGHPLLNKLRPYPSLWSLNPYVCLHMTLCVCVCVCVCVYIIYCIFTHICVCVYIQLFICLCMCVHIQLPPSIPPLGVAKMPEHTLYHKHVTYSHIIDQKQSH